MNRQDRTSTRQSNRFSTVVSSLLLCVCGWCMCGALWAQSSNVPSHLTVGKLRPRVPAKELAQSFFVPLVSLDGAANSEFVINNNATHSQPVSLQLYTLDGEPIATKNLLLDAGETRFLRISDLLADRFSDDRRIGGLSASYFGHFMEVTGQVALLASEDHESIDMPITDNMEFRGNMQNAVWFAPKGSTSTLALGNASNSELEVTVHLSGHDPQLIHIPAFATRLVTDKPVTERDQLFIETDEDKQTNRDSVKTAVISYIGPMGALRTEGFVISPRVYTSSIRFYDPMAAQQANLYATNVPVANSELHLTVLNTSDSPITITPRATSSTNAGAAIELPSISLRAHESRLVDLGPVHLRAASDPEFSNIGVTVRNTGPAGSLVGDLSSILMSSKGKNDESKEHGALTVSVPIRDSGTWDRSAGIYPLRWRSGVSQIVSITNVSPLPATFHAMILYSGQQYSFGRRPLQAGETAQFDIGLLRDKQVPDLNGNKLPVDLAMAKFHWSIVGDHEGRRLIGRNQAIDIATHRASSFSCGQCPTTDEWPYWSNSYPNPYLVGTSPSWFSYAVCNDAFGDDCGGPVGVNVSVSPGGIETVSGQYNVLAVGGGTATVSYVFNFNDSQFDGTECIWNTGSQNESWQDTVSDPTPNITSITPTSWNAGANTSVQIKGTGFGTNPTLSITDPAGAITRVVPTSAGDTEIDATVSISGTAGMECATVKVTSNGYNGQSFFTNQGNSPSGPTQCVPINPPGVAFSGPLGVVNNTSTGFHVTNPNGISLTLTISSSGNGRATFGDGTTSATISSGGTVTVKGTQVSSTANDLKLTAKDMFGNQLASIQFSVIWVTLTFRNTGKYTDDADDSVAVAFSNQEGNILGNSRIGQNNIVIQGTVAPANFTDTIPIKRKITSVSTYNDTANGSTLAANPVSSSGTYTCTSSDQTQCFDDSGSPAGQNQVSTPTASGHLYDLDAPSAIADTNTANDVARERVNFVEFASYGGVPASSLLTWYSRSSSCIENPNTLTNCSNPAVNKGVSGDDQSASGTTTKTTWNLQ